MLFFHIMLYWGYNLLHPLCLQPGQLVIYYELEESEKSSSRGIVEVCPDTHRWEGAKPTIQDCNWFDESIRIHPFLISCNFQFRVTRFLEKPQVGLTESRLASVVFYCIQKDKLSCLSDFLNLQSQAADKSFGRFWVWKNLFYVFIWLSALFCV